MVIFQQNKQAMVKSSGYQAQAETKMSHGTIGTVKKEPSSERLPPLVKVAKIPGEENGLQAHAKAKSGKWGKPKSGGGGVGLPTGLVVQLKNSVSNRQTGAVGDMVLSDDDELNYDDMALPPDDEEDNLEELDNVEGDDLIGEEEICG